MTSAAFNSTHLSTKLRTARSGSNECLQSLEHAPRRPEPTATKKQSITMPVQELDRYQQPSRLELLLLAKKEKPIFIPEEETPASHKANQAIKCCADWSEVQDLVKAAPNLTSSNLAYALYRLGRFAAVASKKLVSDLKASNLIPYIVDQAMSQLGEMEASSLVLLLDGCARTQHQPKKNDLARIALLVQQNAYLMNARQLPLVLWAFSSLHYNPGYEVLLSLEDAVYRQAPEMSPQGLGLLLSSFQAAKHRLADITLDRLASTIQRKLLLFKPSDLATCLKTFAAQGYAPPTGFIQAVAARSGLRSDDFAFVPRTAADAGPKLDAQLI